MMFNIPNYHIYRNDYLDGNKSGTAVAVKKGIPHTHVDLPPLLSLEATGVRIPIGHTAILHASVYKSPLRGRRDADITELLNLRTKSILAGDLNAKHPVWNSKVSYPSGLKLLDLSVNCNFEISAPRYPIHFVPNGRGDVLALWSIKMFGSQRLECSTTWIQITYLSYFAFWIILRIGKC
jgi:hypothetical protein